MWKHRLVGAGHSLLFRFLSHRCMDERVFLRVRRTASFSALCTEVSIFVLNKAKLNSLQNRAADPPALYLCSDTRINKQAAVLSCTMRLVLHRHYCAEVEA